MTKPTLIVPNHYKTLENNPPEPPLQKVYKEVEKYTSQINTLSDSAKERLPVPTGWRVLILPYRGQGKTEAGVHIPDSVIDRESIATVCGYVLKTGPLAFKDQSKFSPLQVPWCKEGDWIIFGRYAGSRFKIDGGEVRLLNDDEVLATIKNPEDIIHSH